MITVAAARTHRLGRIGSLVPVHDGSLPDAVSGANRRLAVAADARQRRSSLAPTPITARSFRRRATGLTDDEALSVRLFEKTSRPAVLERVAVLSALRAGP